MRQRQRENRNETSVMILPFSGVSKKLWDRVIMTFWLVCDCYDTIATCVCYKVVNRSV